MTAQYDAIVIGGGFYGVTIAIYLARERSFSRVLLIECENDLLTRASYNNQARVHNGYHYPRSFTTAFRSRVNFPRFLLDYPGAVKYDFTKLYAIGRRNSKVTAKQFMRFCREIGAKLEPVPDSCKKLFEERLIEEIFLVEEYAFDARSLRDNAKYELAVCNVEVSYGTCAKRIYVSDVGGINVECEGSLGFSARYVFNCTYSGLNQFEGDFTRIRVGLKHEITEMALLAVPPVLKDLGITVMDGPFFSMMPFPARGLHTLSHVRYTPHINWVDQAGKDVYRRLESYDRQSRSERMLRDVARYMPAILDSKYVESLFEIKTVLVKNEGDDGRPILFEKHEAMPNCYSILGGKIDNIYDVLEKLDAEPLTIV